MPAAVRYQNNLILVVLFYQIKKLFQVCWSPKGKQIAICTKQNNLLLCNHELELKSSYKNVISQNLNRN
jgi:hypothetical protein